MATRSNAPLKVYSLRTTSKRSGVYSHVPLPLGVDSDGDVGAHPAPLETGPDEPCSQL